MAGREEGVIGCVFGEALCDDCVSCLAGDAGCEYWCVAARGEVGCGCGRCVSNVVGVRKCGAVGEHDGEDEDGEGEEKLDHQDVLSCAFDGDDF